MTAYSKIAAAHAHQAAPGSTAADRAASDCPKHPRFGFNHVCGYKQRLATVNAWCFLAAHREFKRLGLKWTKHTTASTDFQANLRTVFQPLIESPHDYQHLTSLPGWYDANRRIGQNELTLTGMPGTFTVVFYAPRSREDIIISVLQHPERQRVVRDNPVVVAELHRGAVDLEGPVFPGTIIRQLTDIPLP